VCTPEVYSQDGSLSGGLISLHNLHETLKYVDTVKVLSDDINLFKEYIKKYCKEGVLRCIELVDYNLSNGIEKTSKKYNFIKSKEVSKTPSLMKFVK